MDRFHCPFSERCRRFCNNIATKWERTRSIITKWNDKVHSTEENESLPLLDYATLESDIGFLIHISMAYPAMKPFLRGFYLTLNSWRSGRDKNGWKLSDKAYKFYLELGRQTKESEEYLEDIASPDDDKNAPKLVRAQPLLREHVTILMDMFSSLTPVLRLARGSSTIKALYIFGDASGLGFGASWTSGKELKYRYGVWGLEVKEDSTSNYRELRNLVETLERTGLDGELKGREIYVFTDNTTAESIAAKGSSTSPLLFELVVRLYKLSMKFLCSVNIIHVAGTRIIAQGSDGLYRGNLLEGVQRGEELLSFVPLHISALVRQPSLRQWISSWAYTTAGSGATVQSIANVEFLQPEDWFLRSHDITGYTQNCDGRTLPSYKKVVFVRSPPPAATRFVLEELRQARHKRQDSTHVFIVPKLMTAEWTTQLYKTADLIFHVPFGHKHWPSRHHESLTIAVCFPYLLGADIDGPLCQEAYNYASVIGMLMHLSNTTRLDLSFAVYQCARFTHSPRRCHELALKRIGLYLIGTKDKGLILDPSKHLDIDCFVDADFAGLWGSEPAHEPISVKSRSGWVIMVGGRPVLWASKLQTNIALSTMQTEYVALSSAMRDILPLKALMVEIATCMGLGYEDADNIKTKVWEDNVGALTLSNLEPGRNTSRSKHFTIKLHWFRESLELNSIEVLKVESKD